MTPDNSDDSPEEPPDDTPLVSGGLIDQLRSIIDMLAEIESEERGHRRDQGQFHHGAARVDYEYDVSIGLGRPNPFDQPPDHTDLNQVGDIDPGPHIEIRDHDDGMTVLADLPSVDDEDLDVRLDSDSPAVVLTEDDTVVERFDLESGVTGISDVSYNNNVLEIRLETAYSAKDGPNDDNR